MDVELPTDDALLAQLDGRFTARMVRDRACSAAFGEPLVTSSLRGASGCVERLKLSTN